MITHTPDKFKRGQFLYSKCIIKNVLSTQQWKNPLEEKKFSIQFDPQTYNYNDYRNARCRAFLYYPEAHSCFFNFHDNCPTNFPIWFYHWWTWFGASPSILPPKAKTGGGCWIKSTVTMERYMRKVQFFKQFNIAWLFYWKYRLHQYFQDFFPLSLVCIYEIKWWNEFKVKLCGQENVEHFCKTKTKKFTIHNLHLFKKKASIEPSTPVKKEGSSSSSKSKTKGLT